MVLAHRRQLQGRPQHDSRSKEQQHDPRDLDSWTLDIVRELLRQGVHENERLESRRGSPPPAIRRGCGCEKAVAAVANCGGGFLVIGVRDDRAFEDRGRSGRHGHRSCRRPRLRRPSARAGPIIYAMRVTRRVTMRDYDRIGRTELPAKIPDWENSDFRRGRGRPGNAHFTPTSMRLVPSFRARRWE